MSDVKLVVAVSYFQRSPEKVYVYTLSNGTSAGTETKRIIGMNWS